MENGWIKLHRKLIDWEWYKDTNTKSLFLHLLLLANHETKRWQGNEVKQGQCIVGLYTLSEHTGISIQSIRTSLNKLKSTGEIVVKSTNKFSLITLIKWEDYQGKPEKLTNHQQTTNNNQELKNIRINTETLSSTINYLKSIPQEDMEQFRNSFKCDISNIKTKANSLYDYCKAKGRVYKNYKAFLSNALRKDFGERTQPLVIKQKEIIIQKERTPEEQEIINKNLEKIRSVLFNK